MNPKITITVDAKNRAIASVSGIATVGAKIDVELRGLPTGIANFGSTDDFFGPSVRFRIVDFSGRDLVRFPLVKKSSSSASDGDQWTKTSGQGTDTYSTAVGTCVEFDTDVLRKAFKGVSFNGVREFGVIIDSSVDKAEFALGEIEITQWKSDSTDDPTVLPDWRDIQQKINNSSASVTKVGSVATISITDTNGNTTTATVSDGEDGDVEHVLEGETMKISPSQRQLTDAVKLIWQRLGGTFVMCLAAMCSLADVSRTNEWWDVSPNTIIGNVVDLANKQEVLVSGVNIKTVNNQPLLGSGNIEIQGGGVTPQAVTNIADAVVASSNLCTVAAAQAMTNAATADAKSYSDAVTNAIPRIVSGGNEITADGEISTDWTPSHTPIPEDPQDYDEYFYGIYFGGLDYWECRSCVYLDGEWHDWGLYDMHGDISNPNATSLAFPDFTPTRRLLRTRLATTNDVSTSSAQTLASAKSYADATTNGLATASAATNAAEAVFSTNADYALTNLVGSSVRLASGQIGSVALDAAATNLAVTLDFSAAPDRSGDCLLYLVNATNLALRVGNADVTTVGWDGAEVKSGTNLVMFTRLKREEGKSLVMVSTKEVK